MRRIAVFVMMALLVTASSALAKRTAYYMAAGVLNPKATDSGLMIHVNSSRVFDDKVDFGVSLDFFSKTAEQEETVITGTDPSGADYDVIQTSMESHIYMFPVMAEVAVRVPMEFPLTPLVKAGLGYALLWNSFDNYETGEGETKFYGGLCYRLTLGGMYRLGHSSAFTVEAFYNGCKTTRSEESGIGLPTRTEVDMSGMGIMIGLRLGGFY